MIAWLARAAILGAGGALAVALLPAQAEVRWSGLIVDFSIMLLWLASYFLRWDHFPTAALLGTVAVAVVGLYFGLSATLIAVVLVLALVGWDLDLFGRRLRGFAQVKGEAIIRHLRATSIVAALALGLALLGLHLRFTLGFGLALLLAMASFASLVAILRLGHPAA